MHLPSKTLDRWLLICWQTFTQNPFALKICNKENFIYFARAFLCKVLHSLELLVPIAHRPANIPFIVVDSKSFPLNRIDSRIVSTEIMQQFDNNRRNGNISVIVESESKIESILT